MGGQLHNKGAEQNIMMSATDYDDYIVPSILKDAFDLEPHLRAIDRLELNATGCSDALDALVFSYATSKICYSAISPDDNHSVIAMFGIGKHVLQEHGYTPIWLLGSDILIKKYKIPFLKLCKAYTSYFQIVAGFGPIGNDVMSSNHVHIRWLEWCGFKRTAEFLHPASGVLFYTYVLDSMERRVNP